MKSPFDDEMLIYDKIFHRYKLNFQNSVLSQYVPNVQMAYGSNAQIEIDSQSNNVYTYLYSQTNQSNKDYFEYLLACDETIRPLIFKMLIEQLKYDMQSGGNAIAYEHFMGSDSHYERMVANNVKLIITNELRMSTGADLGIVLPNDRYERWGY